MADLPLPPPEWSRSRCHYFLLRGELVPLPPPEYIAADMADNRMWTTCERRTGNVVKLPNVQEQEDGTILSRYATGNSSKGVRELAISSLPRTSCALFLYLVPLP